MNFCVCILFLLFLSIIDNGLIIGCVITGFIHKSLPNKAPYNVRLIGSEFSSDGAIGVTLFPLSNVSSVQNEEFVGLSISDTVLEFQVTKDLVANTIYGVSITKENSVSCTLYGQGTFVHGLIDINSIQLENGGTVNDYYNIDGKDALILSGSNLFATENQNVIVRYLNNLGEQIDLEASGEIVGGSVRNSYFVKTITPAIPRGLDWLSKCGDPSNPVPSETCAPTLSFQIQVSLDLGLSFSSPLEIRFGYKRPLRAAFMYVGPVDDFGWTYQLNEGRVLLEAQFGATVNVSTYFENLPEGELEALQDNKGNTIASNTPVPPMVVENGVERENLYYKGLQVMKELCDQDFDIVFTGSFGFMSQTVDVSSSYKGCQYVGNGETGSLKPKETFFVNTGGYLTTPRMATGFSKIYQMRYLTGIVAGNELKQREAEMRSKNLFKDGDESLCVGYIAAFPLPEVQRGINAFLLGCREEYPGCIVRVVWSGVWHDSEIESNAAGFSWNVGKCPVMTQHSDTASPQKYYRDKGGSSIGYNSDSRSLIGDSVLLSAMLNWSPVFAHFINQVEANTFQPEQVWLGVDDKGVKIAPFFSPKVPVYIQDKVLRKKKEMESFKKDDALKTIFCGNLTKQWVYKKDPQTGKRLTCNGQPIWEKLPNPEPVNIAHFRDKDGNKLQAGSTPGPTDCLWGNTFPGQALLFTAFPKDDGTPFDENNVFNDYLLEGVELFDETSDENLVFGKISRCSDSSSWGAGEESNNKIGDRFYTQPIQYPKCDGSQWEIARSECNAETQTTEIVYTWLIDNETKQELYCGDELDISGKYTKIAHLPRLSPGPACDYVPFSSSTGITVIVFATVGAIFNAVIIVLLISYRKHPSVLATQPLLVILMGVGGICLNLSSLAFLGEATSETCILRIWSFNISFDLVFSVLWGKIYRVNMLFKNAGKMRRVRIKDVDMVKMAFLLTCIDVLILILWTLIDPPYPQITRDVPVILPANAQGKITFFECKADSDVFMASTLMFKILLILSACGLVFASKNIPKTYVEHKYIIFSAYNTAIFSGVVLLLVFTVSEDPSTSILIHAAGVTFGCAIINGSLAIPRILVATGMMTLPKTGTSSNYVDQTTVIRITSGLNSKKNNNSTDAVYTNTNLDFTSFSDEY